MQRRFGVRHQDVFPKGAYLRGKVEPVVDFQAEKRPDGSRPQAKDVDRNGQGTGLPVWQVEVIDGDEDARKRDAVVTVRIVAEHQPVPPANKSGLPWTPVEFTGLSALPYVDDNGARPRLAWSFRAEGFKSAHAQAQPEQKAA